MANVLNDLEGLLRRAGGECRFGYVIRDTPPPSESLAFDRHNPKIAAKREDLKRFGSLRNLDNLFTLDIPCVSPVRDREKYCGRDASGAVRLLAGRDIRRDGTIAETDESTRWAIVQPEHQIQAGDLVLRRLNSAESTIVLAEVTLADLPAAPSDTVIPLRPRSDLSVEDRLVARLFLASALARRILGATGTLGGHFRISQSELRELPIPQPDQTMSKALQDLSSVSKQLRIWAEDADAIIRSIFRDSGAQQAKRRILSEGRQVRLRADAATELDDFSHIIRSRFPYPLAYRWRVAAAAASEEPRIDTYQSVLEAAEVLLCFSAQVGMAAALRADVQLQAVGQLSEKLKSGRSGPTLGDWTAILKEIATGRRLRGLDEESLLGKLRRFHSESGSSEAIHRFGVKRNDLAHLRRPTALESELSDARNDLETLYRAAIFFTEMPLIQYTRVAWNTLRGNALVEYRELTGDHAIVPLQTDLHRGELLEQGSLYLRDGNDRHLLRPYLIGRTCPSCGHWSTFHLDGARAKSAQLKSLSMATCWTMMECSTTSKPLGYFEQLLRSFRGIEQPGQKPIVLGEQL